MSHGVQRSGDICPIKYRWEIINWIIEKRGYKSYLEVGVKKGECFNRVICDMKTGMDIKPRTVGERIYTMSSDAFFNGSHGQEKFDIIFIDGDHNEEQVDRDILNSLKSLAPDGTIVMHDCNPPTEEYIEEYANGTVYRSFLKLRCTDAELEMFVVDIDWGCGVVQRGEQELISVPANYTWEFFDKNRTELLNIISIEEFQGRFA